MALTEDQRRMIAREAIFEAEMKQNINDARRAINEVGTIFEIDERVVKLVARLMTERDEWRRRAESHGCDLEKGDADCG